MKLPDVKLAPDGLTTLLILVPNELISGSIETNAKVKHLDNL